MTLMISTVWGCAGPGGPGWGAFPLQCEREILRAPGGLLVNGQKNPKNPKVQTPRTEQRTWQWAAIFPQPRSLPSSPGASFLLTGL